MKKIAIICNTGLISYNLATQLQSIFDNQYIIESVSIELVLQENDYDLIFLAPQFGYQVDKLYKYANTHIKILPVNLYNLTYIKELQFIIQQLIED